MSEVEKNKATVLRFLDLAEAGEDIFPLLSEEVEWFVPGSWELAGTYRKDELADVFGLVLSDLTHPPVFTIHSVTAEDNRVAVHARSRSTFKDGEAFESTYHFLFHLDSGKITRVFEYNDTDYMSRLVKRRFPKGLGQRAG
ncbi:hypothetical protein GCM10011371_03070 [Novosphingobium marinum]|uniref:SnoaL-like domain-containing protein n=1 Tax=Novosphingobium marinum TaxID=1514948 RepID=A0A7Y9XT27_9SPHN|nr:nuclear transport factor 2 family protein [Novosphingobium marinum]NYH93999.1 hypothetical protein [Novosphingobium marinum]GGC18821.1 hypothetical protein GCM10011371_03070 [Novosphingobium marinum]